MDGQTFCFVRRVVLGLALCSCAGGAHKVNAADAGPSHASSGGSFSARLDAGTLNCTQASATISVSTANDLTAALDQATPGSTIWLTDGTYTGHFTATVSGTQTAPISLCATRNAILDGGDTTSGYALHITASYWVIAGFTIQNAQKGIVLDGASQVTLTGLLVHDIGEEGIHFRKSSTHNWLINSEIRSTGTYTAGYGEGVYIGSAVSNWQSVMGSASTPDQSDSNHVLNNTIAATAAECIDIKEGTSAGEIRGNTLDGSAISGQNYADSYIDIKGDGYLVSQNRAINPSATLVDGFQIHVVADAPSGSSGNDNTLDGNTIDLTGSAGTGVGIWVQTSSSGNVVSCNNSVTPSGYALLNAGNCQ